MKIKKILNYITLFVAFILIFGFVLACGEVSTKPEKVEELTEEDTEADIEKTYISEITIISLALGYSSEKYSRANSDWVEGKISISEHKAITKKYIEEIKYFYDMYLELKPSKRFEKSYDLFGKAMDHNLKSTTFLQSYVDTDDIEKMARYLDQSINEIDLANEYYLKATEQVKKITE